MDLAKHLKSSIDIVKVIGEYVRLRRTGGAGRYMGLCPFHTEKTPSFSVNGTHQYYYCFGCNAKGSVIDFVMQLEGLTFFEAVKALAERFGVALPRRAEYSDEQTKLRAALYQMHELAARIYRSNLNSAAGSDTRDYLARRGLSPATIEEFGLGLSDNSWQTLTRRFEQEGFSREQMEASGLVSLRQDGSGFFDRFRGRLMFPIHDEPGRIIGFGGRAMATGDEPKYLNSQETLLYRKRHVLYNLHRAKASIRKQERVILVEGHMDVIGVAAAGIGEVVAGCGTSLKDTQVRMIHRHCDRVVVNFDPDTAGANAAERSIDILLDEKLNIRILELEEGLDPDEYIQRFGANRYREKADKAAGYFHWLADRARAKHDDGTAQGKWAAFQSVLPAIVKNSDKLEQAAVANDIASYLGVDANLVRDRLRSTGYESRGRAEKRAESNLPPVERILLNLLLADRGVREEIIPEMVALPGREQLQARRLFETICALYTQQGDFTFEDVGARLDDAGKALLTSVIFADEVGGESGSLEQARACLRELRLGCRKTAESALRSKIRAAEKAGDIAEALRLTEELSRLQREVNV